MKQTPSDVRLRLADRQQLVMTMQCDDDLVDADHPVRVIWQVVCTLDLSRFYATIRARAGQVGRDPTDPRLLVALWLWAATDGVGSARELARLCTQSNPYRWLCGGVSLNHHTLGDFRVDHGAALDDLLTQVIASLVEKKLVSVHRITQDGTRLRACCGASSLRRQDRLKLLLEQARAHVDELKALLDDPEQSAALSAKKKAAMQRAARERRASGKSASRRRSRSCRRCRRGNRSWPKGCRRRTRPRGSSRSPAPARPTPRRG